MHWQIWYLCICASVTTALSCPSGWQDNALHTSCLKLFAVKRTWFTARKQCTALGSTLVHVDTVQMFDLLVTMAGSHRTWLAINDLAEEGVYRGVGGDANVYLWWLPSQDEPSDAHQGLPHTQNALSLKNNDLHDRSTTDTVHFICEMWPEDMQTTKFIKMSMEFLESSNLGYDSDDFFRISTNRKLACAMECRKQRQLCDAFVFSASAKDCYSLRLFDYYSAEVLTATQRNEIASSGSSVYFMIG